MLRKQGTATPQTMLLLVYDPHWLSLIYCITFLWNLISTTEMLVTWNTQCKIFFRISHLTSTSHLTI